MHTWEQTSPLHAATGLKAWAAPSAGWLALPSAPSAVPRWEGLPCSCKVRQDSLLRLPTVRGDALFFFKKEILWRKAEHHLCLWFPALQGCLWPELLIWGASVSWHVRGIQKGAELVPKINKWLFHSEALSGCRVCYCNTSSCMQSCNGGHGITANNWWAPGLWKALPLSLSLQLRTEWCGLSAEAHGLPWAQRSE